MAANSGLAVELGAAHHRGYVVESIEKTVERLVDRWGAGPFFKIDDVPLENVTSNGEPAEFLHNSAFGYFGDEPIELMEITKASPAEIAERFAGPCPGLHHVAWAVKPASVAEVRRALSAGGAPQYLQAGLEDIELSFHETRSTFGHDIEIHADVEGLRGFFAMFREAAQDWDGSDPLRPAFD